MHEVPARVGAAMSRRAFMVFAGRGMAVGAVGLPLLVAGCSPAAPGGAPTVAAGTPASGATAAPASANGAGASGGGVKLPTYSAFAGPQPDLVGNAQGLDPAFYKFPTQLSKTVSQPPGDGSSVSAIVALTLAAPPAMAQNAAWQAVNKGLNATLSMEMVALGDYPPKINTVLAGNDLPDFIYNPTTSVPVGVIAGLPQLLRSKAADLTPYLSGDAVNDYPNLAHFTSPTWRIGVVEGKIYGIPSARPPIGPVMMYRADLFEQAGVPVDKAPKNADDFKRALQAVTRPNDNQYGIATTQATSFGLTPNSSFTAVFNVPNNWKLDAGGKLVKDIETEEFKAAVGFAHDLWAGGLYHPMTPQYGGTINDDFMAGRFAVLPSVWGAYVQLWDIEAVRIPSARLYPLHPFAHDGGKPLYQAGTGNFGVTYIKQQSSPDRVKMMLRIANFFAAPFGSEEWLLNYFGVQGADFNLNADGAPVLTEQGRSELTATWRYVTSPPYALFGANRSREFADVSYAAEQAMMAAAVDDPTVGLYSATALSQGILAQDAFMAGAGDVIQGRRPVSDLDGLVADWRSHGGDKIRAEFQQALEDAKK
jgi:putative aldouronate transport system substrate-binding protein